MGWISVENETPKLPNYDYCSVMVNTWTEGEDRSFPMVYERAIVRGKRVERWKYHWNRIADKAPDFWMPLPSPPDRRPPEGGEINKITVVQHLGRLEDVALRPVSRERVEKVWRGEWIWDTSGLYPKPVCSKCGEEPYRRSNHTSDLPNYCPKCGAPMTDEAVQMVMERLERLRDE